MSLAQVLATADGAADAEPAKSNAAPSAAAIVITFMMDPSPSEAHESAPRTRRRMRAGRRLTCIIANEPGLNDRLLPEERGEKERAKLQSTCSRRPSAKR